MKGVLVTQEDALLGNPTGRGLAVLTDFDVQRTNILENAGQGYRGSRNGYGWNHRYQPMKEVRTSINIVPGFWKKISVYGAATNLLVGPEVQHRTRKRRDVVEHQEPTPTIDMRQVELPRAANGSLDNRKPGHGPQLGRKT